MRFRPSSRAIIAGASLVVSGWVASVRPIQADEFLMGSSLIPTSAVVSSSNFFPTSYFPTSYVVPTSTYLPTSSLISTSAIFPTSSILETGSYSAFPTSNYVTSYRTGGLFRRRLIERTSYYSSPTTFLTPTVYTPTSYIVPTSTYLPTSYVVPSATYVPTTYLSRRYLTPTSYMVDDGLISTSVAMAAPSSVCTESAPIAPSEATPTRSIAPRTSAVPSTPGPTIYSQRRDDGAAAAPAERAPSSQVRPEASNEETATPLPPPATPKPEPAPTPARSVDPATPPERDTQGGVTIPSIPRPGELGQPKSDEMTSRTSYRPVTYSTRPSARNVLKGRVVSFDTGRPEEAVRVILANRGGTFEDRQTQTDADGEFKISLPDGDWVVKVTMPSNSVYTVGRTMTASAGRVVDPNGKNVGELVITR